MSADTITYRGEVLALPIYLDNQATTPVDPRVLDCMLPYFRERFGNPHSVHHRYGWEAEEAVEEARAQVAALIGAEPREIVFTSGATESNNLAIGGAARFHGDRKRHVVTCATEHKCVLEACAALAREGFAVTCLPVDGGGRVDPDALAAALRDQTVLVSVMAVNNEIGTIQPVAEIGRLCAERGVLFHCDAAQAAGRVPLDVRALGVDLMSLSGHKLYGPKGIGALYVRRRPRARIAPLILGGGQERGLRSGTLPVPLCVGLGAACDLGARDLAGETARIGALRDRLLEGIAAGLDDIVRNGDPHHAVPGTLNLSFPGLADADLIAELPDLAVSTGSACTSADIEPSYVLRAIGLDDALAHASIRFGAGRFTTEAEIDFAAERVVATVRRLRAGGAARAAGA